MRFKRKPITKTTTKELESILSPYYGNKDNGGYFIGADFGPGWNDIVLDLHNKIVKEHPDYYIVQIKEKFGTLRFYTGPIGDEAWEYVTEAERLSEITCEECGRPGVLRGDRSWIQTLCDKDVKLDKINTWIWVNLKRNPMIYYWRLRFAHVRWQNRNKGEEANNLRDKLEWIKGKQNV